MNLTGKKIKNDFPPKNYNLTLTVNTNKFNLKSQLVNPGLLLLSR